MANLTMQQYQRGLRRYNRLLKQEILAELNDSGNTITREARQNHNFNTRSGALERSIQHELDRSGMTLTVFLEDRLTTTSSGKSYGVFQHEGTYDGYRKSPMAPSFSHRSGSPGIKADPFLWGPFAKEVPKLQRRLEKVPEKAEREAFR